MKMVKLPNSETPITDLPDREELVGILQRALNECDDSALKNNNSNNVPHLAQYGRRHSADSHPVEASDVFSAPHEEPLEGDAVRRRLPPARQKSCREFSFGKNSNSGSPKMNKNVVIPRRSSMCGPYPAYFSSGLKNKPGMMLSTSPNAQPPKRFSLSNYDDNDADPQQQQQQRPAAETMSQPMDATVSAAADAGAAAARSFLLEALGGGAGGGGAQSGGDRTASSPLSFLGDSLMGAQHQSTQQQQQVNRRSSVGPGGASYNPPTSFTLSSASAATRNALTEYHRNAVVAQQTGRRSSDSLAVPMCHSTFDRRLSAPFDFDHASSSPYVRSDSQRSIDQTPPSPQQQAGGPIRRRSSITSGATAAVRRNSLSNTAKDVKVHKAKAGQKAQRQNSMSNNNTTTLLNKDGSEKKRTWKKPKDKPRRPLSAYNLFFKSEREVLIKTLDPLPEPVEEPKPEKGRRKRRHRKTHGKIGFADLARNIAEKWKNLDEETRAPFEAQALKEKERYRIELEAWNKKKLEEHDKAQAEAAAAKKEEQEQQCENEGEQQEQSKEVDVKKEEQDEPKPTVVKSESQQVEQKPSSPPLQSQESSTSSNSDNDEDETMSESNDKVSESLTASDRGKKHPTTSPSTKFQPMSSLRLDGSSSMMDELAASIRSSDLKDMDSIVMNQSTFFDDHEPLPARCNNCSGSITPLPANFAANAGTTTMDASEIDQRLADVLNDQDAEVEKLFTSLGTMQGSAMEDAFGLGGDEFMKFDLSSTSVDATT